MTKKVFEGHAGGSHQDSIFRWAYGFALGMEPRQARFTLNRWVPVTDRDGAFRTYVLGGDILGVDSEIAAAVFTTVKPSVVEISGASSLPGERHFKLEISRQCFAFLASLLNLNYTMARRVSS